MRFRYAVGATKSLGCRNLDVFVAAWGLACAIHFCIDAALLITRRMILNSSSISKSYMHRIR